MRRGDGWHLAALAAAALSAAQGPVEARQETLLSGAWEYQKVADLTYPPPGAWRPIEVPGYLSGTNYERAWLRRTFEVPDPRQAGRRLIVRFLGAKYNSTIYVNGREVGGHFGGHEMFEVDITDAVKTAEPNELLVGVHDWTGLFNQRVELAGDWDRMRDAPRDAILAPIGGIYGQYGIWDDVYLLSVPEVYVADVFAQPSVRGKRLSVRVEVRNERDTAAVCHAVASVRDGEDEVLRLPEQSVTIEAGGSASLTSSASAGKLEMWWPNSPKLHTLRVELTAPAPGEEGAGGDLVDTRFGYRELWTDGPWFVLNERRIVLRASSWWPPRQPETREYVEETIRAIKAANTICFRTHTQPWRRIWYDVADELGLLIIPEGAVWNDDGVYRIEDEVFWRNYADHLERMVRQHKNHPSVIMWSLENEFYGGRLNDDSPAKAQLVELGRKMKQWDPTRPITYESDLDPGGVADVIGLHYPHEYPEYYQYPDTCYWMDEPKNMQNRAFTEGEPMWQWDRQKPLYIGEFLWIPSSNPDWHTVFFGDDAYIDYHDYRNRGKAESWRMQIEGYRWYRVSGMCPWTMGEGGALNEDENHLYRAEAWAYQPIAAFVREYDARFYSGDTVERTVAVYNDVPEESRLTFRWELRHEGTRLAGQQQRLRLEPAGKRVVTVAYRVPDVRERTAATFAMTLQRDGAAVFEERKPYWLFPRQPLAPPGFGARVALYDPVGDTAKALQANGVVFTRAADLSNAPAADILIIGDRALKREGPAIPVIGRADAAQLVLSDFVTEGGRLLVLQQEAYPEGVLPASLTDRSPTMCFPQVPLHPILDNVRPEDLKWWRGDHVVSRQDVLRPSTGGAVPIIVSGGQAGINYCPLLELRRGRGTIVLSQLSLISKLETEPAARTILRNVLRYLADYQPTMRKTVVVSEDGAFVRYLDELGLVTLEPRDAYRSAGLGADGVVIVNRDAVDQLQPADAVARFVEGGGTVLLHRPTPESLEAWRALVGADVRLAPNASPLFRHGSDPITSLITREDLYWLGEHVGSPFATTPLATDVADYAVTKTFTGAPDQTFDARRMTASGQIVQGVDDGMGLFTVGALSREVDFGEGGAYILGARLRGTPALGVWPNAQFSVDGKVIGLVGLIDGEWRDYATFGDVPAGHHTLTVAFTNDGGGPGEDRNLFVSRVFVGKDAQFRDGVKLLTQPAALARIPRGKGSIVVDEIRWDTEERNAIKARRLAAALLTALGCEFRDRPSVALECEAMKPVGEIAWFRQQGTSVYLGSSGAVAGEFECANAGQYALHVVAAGTKAAGQYPIVSVRIDNDRVGEVELTTSGWRAYPLTAQISEGLHTLTLAFTNDLYEPPEDRNLQLDKVEFREGRT